jgi:hypothetical protein
MKRYGVTMEQTKEGLLWMSRAMNDPRLDATWKALDAEIERRNQEKFYNLLKIAALVDFIGFCIWFSTYIQW